VTDALKNWQDAQRAFFQHALKTFGLSPECRDLAERLAEAEQALMQALAGEGRLEKAGRRRGE
jgi:hypothetical protein